LIIKSLHEPVNRWIAGNTNLLKKEDKSILTTKSRIKDTFKAFSKEAISSLIFLYPKFYILLILITTSNIIFRTGKL